MKYNPAKPGGVFRSMTEKPSMTISEKANYLFDEYVRIVLQVFPGVVALDEMMLAFNQVFPSYQDSKRKKMLPSSLREGKVSCSSAAAITGVWWYITRMVNPTYFVEEVGHDSGTSKSGAHVVVGLPESQDISLAEVNAAYLARLQNQRSSSIEIVDYTWKHNLGHAVAATISPDATAISGNYSYLMNRVRNLGLKSKDLGDLNR